MALIRNNHMIEQSTAAIADPSFCNAIPPRASETGPFWLDAQGLDCLDYLRVEVRGYVKDQILRGGIVGNASRSCCVTHALVGWRVTSECIIRRRSFLEQIKVGTIEKAIAAIPPSCRSGERTYKGCVGGTGEDAVGCTGNGRSLLTKGTRASAQS